MIRVLASLVLFVCAAQAQRGRLVNGVERLLYVTDRQNLSIYDINNGHKFLRKLEVPDTGAYKGISVSVPLGMLYLMSNRKDDVVAVDLKTEKVVWRNQHAPYPDSSAITPDGMRLYIPYRGADFWLVLDAKTGNVLKKIPVARGENYTDGWPIGSIGPHNTWVNKDGSRMYMEVLTVPYVFVVDTKTDTIIGKTGPFTKGVRPFCVSDDEKYVYANVDRLLGFEIGLARTEKGWGGPMIERVEAKTPPERLRQIPNPPAHKPHSTPSHGVNIRPDQKEVWAVDGVYGYVYAFDVTQKPAKLVANIPLFKDPAEQPHPGWVSFSIDGKYAYPDGGAVVDAHTHQIIARIPTSEKLVEIQFDSAGKPIKAGHR
ncbi:MAG: hypothetical protein FJW39_26820 [Acidobacteria bacterium]|nr:hypothetical protein [Acidobacteriota bacterium]